MLLWGVQKAELERGLDAWRAAVLNDPQARWDAQRDLAYWRGAAPRYERARLPMPRTLRALSRQLRPEWSLLDVGAGTGRLTRPLSAHVRRVTALDYSAAMLETLRAAGLPSNARVWQDDFHALNVPKHDAVLAAWVLYRSADLRAAVRRLWELSAHALLILEDNDLPSQHAAWKRARPPLPWPRSALVAALLREVADTEEVEIHETQREEYADLSALFARHNVKARQAELSEWLSPYLRETAAGWEYRYVTVNTLLIARR